MGGLDTVEIVVMNMGDEEAGPHVVGAKEIFERCLGDEETCGLVEKESRFVGGEVGFGIFENAKGDDESL